MKKQDFPVGNFKCLIVVSPQEPGDNELLLEPNDDPVAKTHHTAIFEQRMPHAAFAVEDIPKECERLKQLGVVFTIGPTATGPLSTTIFYDACANLIQLYQFQSALRKRTATSAFGIL